MCRQISFVRASVVSCAGRPSMVRVVVLATAAHSARCVCVCAPTLFGCGRGGLLLLRCHMASRGELWRLRANVGRALGVSRHTSILFKMNGCVYLGLRRCTIVMFEAFSGVFRFPEATLVELRLLFCQSLWEMDQSAIGCCFVQLFVVCLSISPSEVDVPRMCIECALLGDTPRHACVGFGAASCCSPSLGRRGRHARSCRVSACDSRGRPEL